VIRALACALAAATTVAVAQPRAVVEAPRSGLDYASEDVRAMQSDDVANPGMLWVERGAVLWREPTGETRKSCASCHGDDAASMRGVAARYPAYDRVRGTLLDIEARIDGCRTRYQRAAPFGAENDERLALAAFVSNRSRGMPIAIAIDGPAREWFERGRAFYQTRRGQIDLACDDCHVRSVGKRLLGETISQGHPNAFPAYRLEWQTVGSLTRRIRSCLNGVRAEVPAADDPVYLSLALYLASRAQGLAIEAPGVRR
jgi:sulfur-oxidizing protein SoxA